MEEWMGNSNLGVAIIRVSTQRQKDNSPDAQEQVIREYANKLEPIEFGGNVQLGLFGRARREEGA